MRTVSLNSGGDDNRAVFGATELFVALGIAALIFVSRLLPHPGNFNPVMALGLFGGAVIANRWLGIAAVLVGMIGSDLFIGMHILAPVVYLSLVGMVLLGHGVAGGRVGGWCWNVAGVGMGTVFGTLQFFVLTNLGVWMVGELYPRTGEGLLLCFIAALPFLKTQLVGNLFYSAVIFGSAGLLKSLVPIKMLSGVQGGAQRGA